MGEKKAAVPRVEIWIHVSIYMKAILGYKVYYCTVEENNQLVIL